jgi:hypothetical protein
VESYLSILIPGLHRLQVVLRPNRLSELRPAVLTEELVLQEAGVLLRPPREHVRGERGRDVLQGRQGKLPFTPGMCNVKPVKHLDVAREHFLDCLNIYLLDYLDCYKI